MNLQLDLCIYLMAMQWIHQYDSIPGYQPILAILWENISTLHKHYTFRFRKFGYK